MDYRRFQSLVRPRYLIGFLIVGGFGALIDNGILYGLVNTFHIAPTLGAIVSKETSILTMFVLNEFGTYQNTDDRSRWRRLIQSNINRLGGVIIGVGVLYLITRYTHLYYILANIIGIGFGFVSNFLLESILTWRIHEEPDPISL